jgi:hypothetical protein
MQRLAPLSEDAALKLRVVLDDHDLMQRAIVADEVA